VHSGLVKNSDVKLGKGTMQHSFWLVPLIVKSPEILMQKLRVEGFDSTTGTTSLKSLGDASTFAAKLMNSVLYLPIYPSVPSAEVTRLAQLINL